MSSLIAKPDQPDELERSSRLVRILVTIERVLTCAALLLTLGLVITQVVSRYVFHSPFTWTEEVARFALVWLAFLGAGFVMSRRTHIVVDLLVEKLGLIGKRIVNIFAISVVLISSVLMTWAGTDLAIRTAALKSPAAAIPMPFLYSAVAVGFALIFIHGVLNTVFDLKNRRELSVGTTEIEVGMTA